MKIDTRKYVSAHGRMPRGRGHWYFELIDSDRRTMIFFNGEYSNAKRHALESARRFEYWHVRLMP